LNKFDIWHWGVKTPTDWPYCALSQSSVGHVRLRKGTVADHVLQVVPFVRSGHMYRVVTSLFTKILW